MDPTPVRSLDDMNKLPAADYRPIYRGEDALGSLEVKHLVRRMLATWGGEGIDGVMPEPRENLDAACDKTFHKLDAERLDLEASLPRGGPGQLPVTMGDLAGHMPGTMVALRFTIVKK